MKETTKAGASKLTKERVLVIKELFNFKDLTDTEIGNLFGVSRELINQIRHGNRWNDVTGIRREVRSNDFREFGPTAKEKQLHQALREGVNAFLKCL